MKQTSLLLLWLLLALTSAKAQQVMNPAQAVSTAGTDTLEPAKQAMPDKTPEFPGGEEAMFRFLGKNVRYPAAAQRAGKQGTVLLSLSIAADGAIEDIKVLKPLDPLLDNESIRVVKLMPKWNPALSKGVPVASTFLLPVSYRMMQQPNRPAQTGF